MTLTDLALLGWRQAGHDEAVADVISGVKPRKMP